MHTKSLANNILRYNLVIIRLLIFSLLYTSNVFAQDCTCRLNVKTNNPHSAIFINDKFSGTGNLEIELPKGRYFIQVKTAKNNWSITYPSDSVFFDECNEKKSLFFTFTNKIYLSTVPSDVSVIYRDSIIGHTPIFLSDELRSVNLKKSNYVPLQLSLYQNEKLPLIQLDKINKTNGKSFLKTNLFKILLGSALVFGTTAAYYKLKADDNFDLYNQTQNSAYLDKTDKYDLISGVAFGALQINFGVLIYYFLTD